MKLRLMAAISFAAALYSCDDSTTGIGDFVSGIDKINAYSATYNATSKTVLKDKIFAKTNRAYLGRYTDPDFGLFSADFITQINCPENFEFPETIEGIVSTDLEFVYVSFYGDSLANQTLQVDELGRTIEESDADDLYYTSYDPKKFLDENGEGINMQQQTFAVADHALSDSIKKVNKYYYHSINLNKLNDRIYSKYKENKGYFKDSYSFINNVLKGFYVHVVEGEGSVIYIDDISLKMKIKYKVKRNSTGVVDSTAYAFTRFSASKEVLTSTRMEHNDRLQELEKEDSHTYIKTPAGLCTEMTLPIEEMYSKHKNDTLNSVTLSLKKYRYVGDGESSEVSPYEIGAPQNLLMVRTDDYKGFFEENKIFDDKTSFLATYDKTTNTYRFSKLNRLVSHIFSELRENEKSGKQLGENWNKVLLIPVVADVDSKNNNAIIGISNDLSVSAARLFGGEGKNGTKIEMEVTYTNP